MTNTATNATCETSTRSSRKSRTQSVSAPCSAGVVELHYYLDGSDWTGGNLGMAVRQGFDFCKRGVPAWHHLDATCSA